MSETNTVARALNDLGLAAWFGGSLMGAIGVNGAAATIDDPRQRARAVHAGWARWAPVNALAVAAHVVGGTLLIRGNKGRLAGQHGVAGTGALKTVVKLAAMAATVSARYLGRKAMDDGAGVGDGATTPTDSVPGDVERARRQLALVQCAVPVLTGAALVLNARLGEQQRPEQVATGVARRLAGAR